MAANAKTMPASGRPGDLPDPGGDGDLRAHGLEVFSRALARPGQAADPSCSTNVICAATEEERPPGLQLLRTPNRRPGSRRGT